VHILQTYRIIKKNEGVSADTPS